MKTALAYGFGIALVGAGIALVSFFLGLHTDPSRFALGQKVSSIAGIAITVIGIGLGLRARRAELPATEPFGYARALGTGTLIGVFSAFFSSIFLFVYTAYINPAYTRLSIDVQMAELEARGVPPAQIDQMESMMRTMTSPGMQSVLTFVAGVVMAFIFALILAAFLKRPAVAATTPPPLG